MSRTKPVTATGGDEALTAVLRRAGSPWNVEQVRDLVAGVLAAPPGFEAEVWMNLVGDGRPVDAELRDRLRALHAEMSAARNAEPPPPARRLELLRAELARRRLAGFVVPRTDEHQGEYVAPRADRLKWLTGFSGSAGQAVVLADRAAIFVDGRYTLQVRAQVDERLYACRHLTEEPAVRWIAENLPAGASLGYDPWLHTTADVSRLAEACAKARGRLTPCDGNPIDAVWSDQPPAPIAPVVAHDVIYAGRSSAEKRRALAEVLVRDRVDAAVLTSPDSIAWLFNVRGGDVPCTPVALGFAILLADASAVLFMDRRKLAVGLAAHLGSEVRVRAPSEFGAALDALGAARRTVRVAEDAAPSWVVDRLRTAGAQVDAALDPCQRPKACKNAIELEGTRAAHRRDGAQLTRFLAWLAREYANGGLTEIDAARRLESLRRENDLYRGPSFQTISGAGPNGAIVHYRVTPATNRTLEPGTLYLVDSGGQYLDGTTDVTRTIAIGTPCDEMRDRFTRVLKGHIALATVRFPKGTTGSQLDALARRPLWEVGLDYDHGTGHGVGSYLAVHEGPQRISKVPNRAALEPGMIVSNEPGYYKPGAYGIRIENLVTVMALNAGGAEAEILGFETLTLAPIDLTLVDVRLLTADEIRWLDDYHRRVRTALAPLVDSDTRAWLGEATRALGRGPDAASPP